MKYNNITWEKTLPPPPPTNEIEQHKQRENNPNEIQQHNQGENTPNGIQQHNIGVYQGAPNANHS